MAISEERLRALLKVPNVALLLRGSKTEERSGYRVEYLNFVNCSNEPVRGILTRPLSMDSPGAALIYAHAHGGRYDIGASELTEGRPELLNPLGPILAHLGFVTLAIDMPTFGERATQSESAAAKAALWYGQTLFGKMLGEQAAAITYLSSRSDVDVARVGMLGMSMGSTLTYWLAAIEPRLAAIAHLCCFADFATLVETGAHDRHGFYLSVPGLLAETSTGEIGGLVAPRPQLICVGEADPLTPPVAVDRALAQARAAYGEKRAAKALEFFRQSGVGHEETTEMREVLTRFLKTHLQPGS